MAECELERHVRASRRLDLSGIDFGRVPDHRLSQTEVRPLTFMMDIETHAVLYLRDLLATSAARDPEVPLAASL